MTFYTASFETVTLRFALMMGVIIVSFTLGHPIFGIIGLPIFISAMLGISFTNTPKKTKKLNAATKQISLEVKNNAA